MIVYLATKSQFRADILSNRIEEKVLDSFKGALGRSVGDSELTSWKNSLPFMDRILDDTEIPQDTGVAIEFNIPYTAKRIDFILTGTRDDGQRTAVIVELKQWQKAEPTSKDAIVSTFIGGCDREVNHPSYQAWSYAMLVEDFNETVRLDPIHLKPCAYLHNCESDDTINGARYADHTRRAPAFLKDDAKKLRDFIKTHVRRGDGGETMYRIRDGRIRPSKGLADHLASLLQGKQEFYMIDDQKVVYETALSLAQSSNAKHKNVMIVNGGPGTGKTVVAINLLVELTQRKLVAQYVTKNSAPRAVYESKLAGNFTKSRISSLFVGSGGFTTTPANTFQALIVDEAHRLNEKSGLFSNMGENQIKELIESASFTVFFLDEDQRIHWKDIGEKGEIAKWAETAGAKVTVMDLESQFRCNGSNGFLAWVDNALQIRSTANTTLEGANYEFKACATASELRDLIYERNRGNNKARMVAGYCWDWKSKKTKSNTVPSDSDIEFPEQGFAAKWNLSEDGSLWIVKPGSVKEVGCIHTCQGLDLDYVGVIVGEDFLVRDGKVVTDATARSRMDSTIKGFKKELKTDRAAALKKADEIIKNTYRTLMTRGMKGCYLYSVDPETNHYFQKMSRGALLPGITAATEITDSEDLPFRIVPHEELRTTGNVVPMINLKIAAGTFSTEQWLEDAEWIQLPDHLVAKEGYFVAQVMGESMNRRIPNGSWCLFQRAPAGSREGKIVMVQCRDIQDPDTGGHYTVKRYHSEKRQTEDNWKHQNIVLHPESDRPEYNPISLNEDDDVNFSVLGEFVAIVG